MTKMKSANMDVVRFDESDVIVSSGPVNVMKVSGMGNDNNADGKITYIGVPYSIYDLTDFYSNFNQANRTNIGGGTSIYVWPDYVEQVPTTLDQLDTWEVGTGDTDKVNGAYIWDGSAFHHQ